MSFKNRNMSVVGEFIADGALESGQPVEISGGGKVKILVDGANAAAAVVTDGAADTEPVSVAYGDGFAEIDGGFEGDPQPGGFLAWNESTKKWKVAESGEAKQFLVFNRTSSVLLVKSLIA